MKHILILGAKSDIAKALAEEYAKNGYNLILTGKEIDEISDFSTYLTDKYTIQIKLATLDVLDITSYSNFTKNLNITIFGVICCVGYLGNQLNAENNINEQNLILQTNYFACVNSLSYFSKQLKENKEGFIIGISSVAGDRGRKSNYFYGSAKAGFTAYLSGLSASLAQENIHVLTVKPGFVYTKMTADLELPKILTITPKKLAAIVYKAQQKKKNTIYIKWFWRYIMLIIKNIPEVIFKKMNL